MSFTWAMNEKMVYRLSARLAEDANDCGEFIATPIRKVRNSIVSILLSQANQLKRFIFLGQLFLNKVGVTKNHRPCNKETMKGIDL